ncbi:MAG: hypothetical protein JWL63_2494 [Rhodocyclales bacterium]|nr:hypothetical protein [Rhodocyclales bacterium]
MFTVTALDFLRAGETESTQANLELTLDMYVLARANYEDNPLLVSKYFEKTTYEPGFYNMPLRSVRNYRKKYPPRIQDKESLKKIFRVLNEKK